MNKKKILIITAKYYSSISEEMESKTVEYLQDHFSDFSSHKSSTIIKTVPGVFEIPVVIARNIKKMILVTRSRKKVVGLEGYGIKITKQEIIK